MVFDPGVRGDLFLVEGKFPSSKTCDPGGRGDLAEFQIIPCNNMTYSTWKAKTLQNLTFLLTKTCQSRTFDPGGRGSLHTASL